MSRALEEYKDIYSGFLGRARDLIVSGHWHLKKNSKFFKAKKEDFDHVQNATEAVVDALETLLEAVDGDRQKPGVQPYIKEVLSTINIHLDRVEKYYDSNLPQDHKSNEDKRSEGTFQQYIFKGEQKIRAKIKTLNIENDMSHLTINFYDKAIATLPMKDMLCQRDSKIRAKVESLDIDWDLIMDNGLYINMGKKDVPEYNAAKHFWEQDEETLQFWVSEYNKIKRGYTVDGYHISPSLYFHINFFKTPIKNHGNKIMNPPLRDNEWYFDEIKKYAEKKAKEMERAGVIIYGTRRFSKALKDDEPLYYEDGERPIGEAKVGDKIYGADGNLTKIVGVYPQGEVDLYTVKFGDGREVVCCDEHLWYVYDYQAKKYKTLPLKEIISNGYSYKRSRMWKEKERESTIYNYYIPLTEPVNYKKKDLSLDPYFLGVWLGDGHSKATRVTTMDSEIVEELKRYCKEVGTDLNYIADCGEAKTYSLRTQNGLKNYITTQLKEKKLWGNKHIPKEYYRGSVEQRLELLRGLMDTDGTIGKGGGGISFVSSKEGLAKDVLQLCRSLGINSYIKKHEGAYTKKSGELNTYWKVTMFTNLPIFKLKRKLERIDTTPNKSREGKRHRVPITSIEYLEKSNATCIRVDNIDKLFLTRDYIVTHNTTQEASHVHHGMVTNTAETGTVTSSNATDLASIIDKIKKSLDYVEPAFRLNINSGKDFEKEVLFGLKSSSGRESYEHFTLSITNTESGSKKGSQKTAGGNPKVFVGDEIGKSTFITSYQAAIPSFESDEGFVCIPIYTGTGGDEDLSEDAEKVLTNPTNYGFLDMDWDILEYGVPKEAITWQRRTFGWFIPAQMSTYTGMRKIKTNFAEFLGIESEELSKIVFYKTDWIHNTEEIKRKRSKMRGATLTAEKVFRPIDPDECFMSAKNNPFPAEAIKVYRAKLISETNDETGPGKPIVLRRDKDTGKVYFKNSSEKMAMFPHPGGFINAPGLLFGEFPETTPPRFRFIAGFDDYKHEQSDGDSVSGFCIFDRIERRIVFSLAARPDPHGDLHSQIHMALDAWNAICFPENEDMKIKEYFDRIHQAHLYLGEGFDPYGKFARFSNTNRKYGWQPDKFTTPFVRGLVTDYAKEVMVEGEGERGFERIEDIYLLEEMVKYRDGKNYDRIIGLGSALLYDYYLTSKHIFPRMPKTQSEEDTHKKKTVKKPTKSVYYAQTRRRLF